MKNSILIHRRMMFDRICEKYRNNRKVVRPDELDYGQIYETFIYFNNDDFDLFFRKEDYKEVFQLFIEVVKAAVSSCKT